PAKQRQGDGGLRFAGRDIEAHPAGAKLLDVRGARVGARPNAEINRTPTEVASELAYVGIVTIKDRDTGNRQALHQLIFGTRDPRYTIGEILRVSTANIGHYAPIRVSNAGQGRDFTGMRHAHLDHGDLMFRFEFEELQRHAEFIVEVSLR